MKLKLIKNYILKGITWCMAVLFIVSGCALDSPSWTPTVLCAVSLAWLAVFAFVNGYMGD